MFEDQKSRKKIGRGTYASSYKLLISRSGILEAVQRLGVRSRRLEVSSPPAAGHKVASGGWAAAGRRLGSGWAERVAAARTSSVGELTGFSKSHHPPDAG